VVSAKQQTKHYGNVADGKENKCTLATKEGRKLDSAKTVVFSGSHNVGSLHQVQNVRTASQISF